MLWLVPFQLGEWFDRASTVRLRRAQSSRSAEPLTTPRKIEGPNLCGVRCCNGRERVERESRQKSLERHSRFYFSSEGFSRRRKAILEGFTPISCRPGGRLISLSDME